MAKLYTKQGDEGKTHLVTGNSIEKSNPRLDAYGTLDELNSLIGVIQSLLEKEQSEWCAYLKSALSKIQCDLFILGSRLACDDLKILEKLPKLASDRINALEQAMDEADRVLPPLKNFILPGGHLIASQLQLARCVCRRGERDTVRLANEEEIEPITIKYLNRLSDYLFAMSRLSNHNSGIDDKIWKA